jgi:hypothetical protein
VKVLSFKSKSEVIEEDKKNRIFFHDLINHTHGLILFLNQKITYNKGATSAELELLNNEVKLLQTLIFDHFKYEHKNLEKLNEWVSFESFESSMDLLFKIYFPENIKLTIEKKGKIAFFESQSERNSALIHFPSLYRIMNNLIKNMSEAETSEIQLFFSYTEQNLIIETKNKMDQKKDKRNIVDYLSRIIIRDEAPIVSGIGLDSIHEIVKSTNGNFQFDIKDGQWINRITIPHSHIMTASKKAA